jgi:hypothetical protein
VRALAEEIGIATEVVSRRERDRIDQSFDCYMAGDRKSGDPLSQRTDKITCALAGNARLFQPYRSANSAS